MRHARISIVVQAALCACLVLSAPTHAQLSRVWSYDLGTLGWPGLPDDRAIHIDDSGYCYVLSYLNGQLGGALVSVIRPDSTLAWQYSFPDSGLMLTYSASTAAGDVYVVGGHQNEGFRLSAVALKVNAGGTLAWSRVITPTVAPYFNIDPYAAVGHRIAGRQLLHRLPARRIRRPRQVGGALERRTVSAGLTLGSARRNGPHRRRRPGDGGLPQSEGR
jgi:hypothetical protein